MSHHLHGSGKPAPQGSKKHVGRGILVESSKELGPWRERVALVAHNTMLARRCSVITGAVTVEVEFVLPRPKSTPKKRTPLATRRPDADKLLRAILDAITSVVIADDALAVDIRAAKRLAEVGESPCARITVIPKGEEAPRG